VGSAFDAFVKAELATHLGMADDPRLQLDRLLDDNVDASVKSVAVPRGRSIFDEYVRAGRLDRLLKGGIADIELDRTVELTVGNRSIPFRMKADAFEHSGTPIDWKVQGSVSKSGVSPAQGYNHGVRGLTPMQPHAKAGWPLEKLNPDWALQMTIYNWGYSGVTPWRPLRAVIENLTCRSGKITCTTIDTHITVGYQQNLWDECCQIWDQVCEGMFAPASPHPKRCNAYASLCECSPVCEAYKRDQAGEMNEEDIMRKLIGE
jgi:hypothetical protein